MSTSSDRPAATGQELCNPKTGTVEGEWLALHNRLTKDTTPTLAPFPCTGSACYVYGEHIICTSEWHKKRRPDPATLRHQHEGLALVRVASDIREHFKGDPDVPQEFLDDLDTVEEVGQRMYFSQPITLAAGVPIDPRRLSA